MKEEQDKCNGHQFCNRKIVADGLCQLHLPIESTMKVKSQEFDKILYEEITNAELVEKRYFCNSLGKYNIP